jgi:hypothetical protein
MEQVRRRRQRSENEDGYHHHISPTAAVSNCSRGGNGEHDENDKMMTNEEAPAPALRATACGVSRGCYQPTTRKNNGEMRRMNDGEMRERRENGEMRERRKNEETRGGERSADDDQGEGEE